MWAGNISQPSFRDFGAHIKEMAGHFTSNEKVAVSGPFYLIKLAVHTCRLSQEMLKTTSDLFSELSSYFSVSCMANCLMFLPLKEILKGFTSLTTVYLLTNDLQIHP